jgi:ATPase subunit of ABC transporter with duplicated ATPase domains
MTATLVAKDLAGGHAHRVLFEHLDLTVAPGDVIGVVGANGAGKTTLLRLLAGDLVPLAGTVSRSPSDAFVGWLPQEHQRVPGETVGEYVARRAGCTAAQEAMDVAADLLADPDMTVGTGDPADVYAAALDHWLATGAADLEDRLPVVLAELGFATDDPESLLMTDLSGGQAARVGLAALLCSRFDVVLLDEPTNDLDLDGLARLEEVVAGMRGGVVLVSHDREFLARSVTRVVELDLAQHTNTVYGGGYEAYLEEREVARRHKREEYEEYAERKADLVARARTQREWSSQGVRNAIRKAPDNDKIRRRAAAESSEKQAQKVRQMESRIARLEEVVEPRKEWVLEFSIGSAPRSSTVVATLNNAVVRHGDFTLGPVSLQVNAGDRIGITGPNGAGKTTLLRLLLGQIEPDEGSARSGRMLRSERSIRLADSSPAHSRWPTASKRWSRRCRRRTCGPCWRSSVCAPITSTSRPPPCHRVSGRVPLSHSCRHEASTCSSSTSPPITSTSRRLNSSSLHSTATTARCCW